MCNLDLPTMSHASSILKVSAIGVHSLLSGDLNGNLMVYNFMYILKIEMGYPSKGEMPDLVYLRAQFPSL